MLPVCTFAGALLLTLLYLALTVIERKRTARLAESCRVRLDHAVEGSVAYVQSVNAAEFVEDAAKQLAYIVTHTVVAVLHWTARRIERILRKLRRRIQKSRPRSSEPSAYVKTMREVKEQNSSEGAQE